jgi:hypothetical protein
MKNLPNWLGNFEEEDLNFIKNFVLASGSLKEIAKKYRVTYPTIRLRLDKVIQKIQMSEETADNPFVALIKKLAIEEKLELDTAKLIIKAYQAEEGK